MTLLYGSLGATGYWSRGQKVAEIVIFSLTEDRLAHFAAACILVQVRPPRAPWVQGALSRMCAQGVAKTARSLLLSCLWQAPVATPTIPHMQRRPSPSTSST